MKNAAHRVLPCLLGTTNYLMVNQRCIYFDKSTSTVAVARTRCKSSFNGKGKMYEPGNYQESLNIAQEGNSKFGKGIWWMGVKREGGKFVFDSDGSPVPFTPTKVTHNNGDCVLVFVAYWQMYKCSDSSQMGTLCEYGD